MTRPQRVESLSHAQRERLAYIDFRLYFFGEIDRPDLIDRFGVAPAGATRDLALYREIAPQNIAFDGSNKIYRIGQAFSPLFDHAPQRVLSAQALGFGDGVNGATQPLLPCESPTVLSSPRMDMLVPVCRAIHAKRPVAIRYHSLSSGESERVIIPFALVDTGLRWHVRAFDRKSSEFRDFIITRIEAPTLLDEGAASQRTSGQRHPVDAHRRAGLRAAPASGTPRDHQDGLQDDCLLDSDARSRRCGGLHAAALERGLFARPPSQRRTVPPIAQRSAGAVRR